jgi:hypothetical protein
MPSDRVTASPPWLFRHATRQRGNVASEPFFYDDELQVAVVDKGKGAIPAVSLSSPPQSKKADIEKGEDQKDRW